MSPTTLSPRRGPSVSDLVQLLQVAYPKTWENHLRNLGVSAQADLPPTELARCTEWVFWAVKQSGIKDPAGWLAFRARLQAPMAPVAPVEIKDSAENAGDIAVQRDSVELEPAKLAVDLAKTSDASPPIPVTATIANGTTKAELLSRAKAAMNETKGPKTEITPRGATGRKRGRGGGHQPKKQKLPAQISKSDRKLSPDRMRIVLKSLSKYPIMSHAAGKAGIHRKTLEYWLKRSEAGDDGYDIERQGVTWRFHEQCKSAIDEARDKLLAVMWQIAMGKAYVKDENGDFILETVGPGNSKMMRFFLELTCPEKWGKRRKIDVSHKGHVLVVGNVTKQREYNTAASVKARTWKSISRKIRNAKA